jgi:hypothetical protein
VRRVAFPQRSSRRGRPAVSWRARWPTVVVDGGGRVVHLRRLRRGAAAGRLDHVSRSRDRPVWWLRRHVAITASAAGPNTPILIGFLRSGGARGEAAGNPQSFAASRSPSHADQRRYPGNGAGAAHARRHARLGHATLAVPLETGHEQIRKTRRPGQRAYGSGWSVRIVRA